MLKNTSKKILYTDQDTNDLEKILIVSSLSKDTSLENFS